MSEDDSSKLDWLPQLDEATAAWMKRWGHRSVTAPAATIYSTPEPPEPSVSTLPDVLLQAEVVRFGERADDGQLIAGVAVAWFEIHQTVGT